MVLLMSYHLTCYFNSLMKQRLNFSHLVMVGQRQEKRNLDILNKYCCSWGNITSYFLIVVGGDVRCDGGGGGGSYNKGIGAAAILGVMMLVVVEVAVW